MFYKGKYLITIYDKEGFLAGVFDKARDLAYFFEKNNFDYSYSVNDILHSLNRCFLNDELTIRIRGYELFLIDINEKHDDEFQEEDDLFIDYIKKEKHHLMKNYCEEHNISERTYFRRKRLGLVKQKFEEISL